MSASGNRPSPAHPVTAEDLARELGLNAEEHQLVAALLRLGVTAEQIRTTSEQGRLEGAIFEGVLDAERERRTVSAAQIEANGGLPASDIQEMLKSFGLAPPDPDEAYFTAEEAEAFRELGRLEDVWPAEVRLEIARVYGQALGRIAQTELHLFNTHVQARLKESAPNPLDTLSATRQAVAWLLPLVDPLLHAVHRRKLEHEITQAAAWEVESETEGLPVPGAVDVSLLFLDLRHFTSYANRQGDAKAIEVVGRLGSAVRSNLGERGRLVKELGDGYMLAYPDPDAAVAAALAIAAAKRDSRSPSLHGGLHHGSSLFRDGDYYGRAVNLAARLLSIAKDDQLVATARVAEAAPQRAWESLGEQTLLGFETPIELFSLSLARPQA